MKNILLPVFLLLITACKKNKGTDLKSYLAQEYEYVHVIEGFYIVGSDEKFKGDDSSNDVKPSEVFENSVKLFSNLLDQNEDGVLDEDYVALIQGLAKHFVYVSAHDKSTEKLQSSEFVEKDDLYVIAMKTDKWPYVRDYTGRGFSVSSLRSSTWRPEVFSAPWEEIFHAITETYAKIDPTCGFNPGDFFRDKMDSEINAGTYEIAAQNAEESGQYDKVTATNEYIHQIWAISLSGNESALSPTQLEVLNFMREKDVPMNINPDYSQQIGERVK